MNPYEISQDPIWHRWVDGIVVLVIGIAAGLVVAQAIFASQTVYTVTPATDIVRRAPSYPNEVESGVRTDLPSHIKIQEN